jgi:hypothetical protein
MRLQTLPARLFVLAAAILGLGAGVGLGATASPTEVLSIENGEGTFQIRGRGFLNMRLDQGTVQIVDLTPSDQFSPRLGGVPRGKTSGATGKDINVIILGGRYRIAVRGSGIGISARGDGIVQMNGDPDATGSAGMIRIGDVVRPIPEGESKATFGGAPETASSSTGSQGSTTQGSTGQGGGGRGS